MNILFDHFVPPTPAPVIVPPGEDDTGNGLGPVAKWAPLTQAGKQFDVLLTVDQNIKHQQNLAALPIAVMVLIGSSNKLVDLLPLVPKIEEAIRTLVPCTLVEITL